MKYKTFKEYHDQKIIDQFISSFDAISLEDFNILLASCKKLDEAEIYNELIGGLTNLAQNAMNGIGNGITNMASAGWNAAKNVAGNMANNYAQGENLQQVRRAMTQIQGLQQSLKNMNLRNQNVDNMLMQLTTTLQGYNQRLAQDNTMRTNQPGWHKQPPPIPQTV
jgi:hypothetical protein